MAEKYSMIEHATHRLIQMHDHPNTFLFLLYGIHKPLQTNLPQMPKPSIFLASKHIRLIFIITARALHYPLFNLPFAFFLQECLSSQTSFLHPFVQLGYLQRALVPCVTLSFVAISDDS